MYVCVFLGGVLGGLLSFCVAWLFSPTRKTEIFGRPMVDLMIYLCLTYIRAYYFLWELLLTATGVCSFVINTYVYRAPIGGL